MIPSHILDGMAPQDRVAILSRGGELHFFVHPATDAPAAIRARAEGVGAEVLTTHMQDHDAIREFVAAREPDVGGEG